jgi:hypothetical protein
MNKLNVCRLREVLHYNPETGVFTWLVSAGRVRAGDVAGSISNPRRYRNISIDGRKYLAHRLAWLHTTGEWPPVFMDHINGDTSDNRIANLRPATQTQNRANTRRASNNASGFKGVCWHRRKWRAQLIVNGVLYHLGLFDTPEKAHAAYVTAAEKHFGKFARAA